MLVAQMAAYHKARGMDIEQVMDELYAKYGTYLENVVSFTFEGSAGAEKMAGIMKFFRENEDFMGKKIVSKLDYKEQDELPKADIMEFVFEDESKVIVRPSGTEPKIKIYLFARGEDGDKARQIIEENEAKMRAIMEAE